MDSWNGSKCTGRTSGLLCMGAGKFGRLALSRSVQAREWRSAAVSFPVAPRLRSRPLASDRLPAGASGTPTAPIARWRPPHRAPSFPPGVALRPAVRPPPSTPPGVAQCDRGHATGRYRGGRRGGGRLQYSCAVFFCFLCFSFFAPFHRRPACPCSRHPRLAPRLRARTCAAPDCRTDLRLAFRIGGV